jgi:hypothetical protein
MSVKEGIDDATDLGVEGGGLTGGRSATIRVEDRELKMLGVLCLGQTTCWTPRPADAELPMVWAGCCTSGILVYILSLMIEVIYLDVDRLNEMAQRLLLGA